MKIRNSNKLRNFGSDALCLLLLGGVADAKSDKGKGKDKGGPPGHAEKGKGGGKKDKGGKHDDKGHEKVEKDLHKDIEKDRKDFEKDVKDARKDAEKDAKEFAKWREKRFRDDDRTGVIRYFNDYRDNDHGLPPGLAKKYRKGKPLPPGWQKKVSNGYVIEDDWNGYFYPLEYETFPNLERVPDTRLYLYGDRIVRVYEPRREVIDIIRIPTIRFD